jgi:hypothetical protein
MLAEVFMIWIESLRRHEAAQRTTTPSTSTFVPFDRNHSGCSKGLSRDGGRPKVLAEHAPGNRQGYVAGLRDPTFAEAQALVRRSAVGSPLIGNGRNPTLLPPQPGC